MKICNLPLVLLTLVPFIGAVANAAELASAKVLEVKGSVTYHAQGSEKPLKQGMIIKEGADLTTAPLSNAKLAFSNGSILTIQENSSLSFDELSQKSFNGNKTYEELEADPSESQTRLQLNYGKVRGETKKLRDESNFEVSSPLGTAAIRGTIFSVLVGYNAERGEYSFQVTNENGEVYVISRYSGALDFGRGNVASKGYSGDTEERRQSLPQDHTVIIRLSQGDPGFNDLVDRIQNIPPSQSGDDDPDQGGGQGNTGPETSPEDPGVTVVSPETPDED